MYYYKLFTWKNGKKDIDLTKYLLAPIFLEDRLNEELSTGEVVLDAVPRELFAKPFAPKTKMRIERYGNKEFTNLIKNWDMVVEHDDIEEYTGCPQYLCHRVHLIEPSVVAQGMHVDNIALTYELQDVTMKYKTYNTDSTKAEIYRTNGGAPEPALRETRYENKKVAFTNFPEERHGYFKNTYQYRWDEEDVQKLKEVFYSNLSAEESHPITFNIPKLYCYGSDGNGKFDKKLFQMNVITSVERAKTQNGIEITGTRTTIVKDIVSGPSQITPANNDWYYSDGKIAYLRITNTAPAKKREDGFGFHNILPDETSTFEAIYQRASAIAQVGEYEDTITFPTDTLSEDELEEGYGYRYFIKILANPVYSDGMLKKYEISYTYRWNDNYYGIYRSDCNFTKAIQDPTDPNTILITTNFMCKKLFKKTDDEYLIKKGVKYNCLQLLRKALLTVDTQILDNDVTGLDEFDKDINPIGIEYPIIVETKPVNWHNRLKTAQVKETILENKNLWEVLLQIGYYLHAIPQLKFAEDDTDRFVLTFKRLGDIKKNDSKSTKITVFNSQNLSDFFTQYDSYVTNIFSPQNEVEEWLVCKTSDESMLVSNNTSILKTTYGITEIVEFDITYNNGKECITKSALNYIFEYSIYQILTAEYRLSPSKGEAIFYHLGQNSISGLNYVPPYNSNKDVPPMALKRIVSKLFRPASVDKLKFSSLKFHIKYRTQDSMRVSQVRPDLQNFMKNSSYEKYPHHEQFYGQQDKIIDSERFSLNLFGKLIRVGNCIYQRQEQVLDGQKEKEAGDLVEINNEPYYVVTVENEYYNTVTLQKVTYSKNFNQLSQIVTIPSEPRFYEVSERSKIRREKREFDFFAISTKPNESNTPPRFLAKENWHTFIKNIIFNQEEQNLPNYAWTRFMADKKREHIGSGDIFIELKNLFPSSELDRTDQNNIVPKAKSDHADCIVPLLHFPIKDGIIFEWDMEDNFKAGDFIDTALHGDGKTVDDAYVAQQAMRYCDVFGRADLYTFRLFHKNDWTFDQSQALPKACIEPTEEQSQMYLPKQYAIGLDKDCREELSFNYQISLLYRNDGEGEIVTFSNLFGKKNSELYCILLKNEVSMFDENIKVINENIVADKVAYKFNEDKEKQQLEIKITNPQDIDLKSVKSVVFYEIDDENNKVSYLAKNFKNGIQHEEIPSLYIYPVFNTEKGE